MRRIAVLTLFAAVAIPQLAIADGFPSYKDSPSIRYHSAPTSYRSSSYVAKCDPYLTRWECSRFRDKMAQRAGARSNLQKVQSARQGITENSRNRIRYDRDPRPTRYAASRYPRYDTEPSRRCMASIKVTGVERTLRWRAEESARKAWRRAAIDTHGYQFAGGFQEARVTCDNIRGYVWVCRASGRPCRED